MVGLSGKTESFQLNHILIRSALPMQTRIERLIFFEDIYNKLLREYGSVLSDSQTQNVLKKQVRIADSTSISLFEDILSCVGRKAKDGKSKGEIKVYTVINADTKVPSLVWFSPATINDHNFLDKVE